MASKRIRWTIRLRNKVILPIWHKISKSEVIEFSPIIADLLAINTTIFTIEEVAEQIVKKIKHCLQQQLAKMVLGLVFPSEKPL